MWQLLAGPGSLSGAVEEGVSWEESMRTRSRPPGSEGRRLPGSAQVQEDNPVWRPPREDDIRGPGRGQIPMALETMLKCLDSITYAMGGCWRGDVGSRAGGRGWSQLQSALESALQLLWGATWTVLNKEESYSLKQWQSASVTCFLQLMMLASNSPNPSFFCQGGWGMHCVVFFLHWRPSRVGRLLRSTGVAAGEAWVSQKHPGDERCCQPCLEVTPCAKEQLPFHPPGSEDGGGKGRNHK